MVRDGQRTRLRSWKEIAAFFGADVRTVKRWEVTRGLPVHRPPGEGRAAVFAYSDELSRWLEQADAAAPAPAPATPAEVMVSPPTTPASRQRWWWPAGAAATLAAVVVTFAAAQHRAPAVHVRDGDTDRLYATGVYYLQTRTGHGLELAERYLTGAIARDPADADAYARLAETYEMMAQFADAPADEMHRRAGDVARRAIALDPHEARAFAILGYAAFNGEHDLAAARRWFDRALAADASLADVHLWYAMVLMHGGDQREPLRLIDEAQALDPQSRTILANRALILFHAGRADQAVAILREMRVTDPALRSPAEYLATIYLAEGRWTDFLRESRAAASIASDLDRLGDLDHAATALAQGGGPAMLRVLYAEHRAGFVNGKVPAFKLAQAAMMVGDRPAALAGLADAVRRGEPDVVGILLEPALRPLHGDPVFRLLVRRIGLAPTRA